MVRMQDRRNREADRPDQYAEKWVLVGQLQWKAKKVVEEMAYVGTSRCRNMDRKDRIM